MTMTRGERESLLKVCRLRERVAKAEAGTVAAQRKAEFERQLAAEYSFDTDAVWREARNMAQAVTAKANEEIAARAQELGIPRQFMPSLSTYWLERGENASRQRRAELTRVAHSRIAQLEKEAKLQIDRASVEIQTRLVADGLDSADARAFLESMPTAAQLMPPVTVEEVQKQLCPPREID